MPTTIEIPRLRSIIVRRLEQRHDPAHADLMADSVLFGELVGRASHGIARLLPGSYGPMDEVAAGEPTVERIGPTSARVTGGPGILVAAMATDAAIEMARASGVAAVATTGSHSTSGTLTYFVEKLTVAGNIALVVTNTVSFVAPPKGRERILGTNPIAVGVPTLGLPFILDMATSAITGGELIGAAQAGRDLPEAVAIDASGTATTDAGSVLDGGSLLAFGGHKGLGLSMMVQLLAGVFGGSATLPLGADDDWSHAFVAVSLDALGDPTHLRQVAQDLVERIRHAETADGSEVRIPGHRSLARRDSALASGTVDVDTEVLEQLLALL